MFVKECFQLLDICLYLLDGAGGYGMTGHGDGKCVASGILGERRSAEYIEPQEEPYDPWIYLLESLSGTFRFRFPAIKAILEVEEGLPNGIRE